MVRSFTLQSSRHKVVLVNEISDFPPAPPPARSWLELVVTAFARTAIMRDYARQNMAETAARTSNYARISGLRAMAISAQFP